MDLQKLQRLKHWLEYSSFTLNLENYVILSNSLLVLQNENHFRKVFFWGLIEGLNNDYYISFGYKSDAIKGRSFFYSEDCQNWKLLPTPHPQHFTLTELCKRPFEGDPGLIVEVIDDAPEEEETDTEDEVERGGSGDKPAKESAFIQNGQEEPIKGDLSATITSGELKEEDRLAAIVHIITEETAVVPRGALFKQTDGCNTHSQAFEGLNLDDVDELCSFQHFRHPQKPWNTNLLTRVDYNYAMDFLDTINSDIPQDVWSAQLVEGDRTVILRNLAWPGFTFFHHLTTPDHGCIYIGPGQRNLDIPFMTQTKHSDKNSWATEEFATSTVKPSFSSLKHPSISKKPSGIETKEYENNLPTLEDREDEPDSFGDEIITSA